MSALDVKIGSVQIHALNVRLREDLLLDEVHLEGGDIALSSSAGGNETFALSAGETVVRAIVTEPNLNRMVAANVPSGAPVRNVRVAILSGKLRVTGELTKAFGLPITLEAIPRVENGVRISAEWKGLNAGRVALPGAIRDVLESYLNETIDLTTLPVPVYVTEIRCEPGRVTILGKVRLSWPLALLQNAPSPFAPRELSPGQAADEAPALPPGN